MRNVEGFEVHVVLYAKHWYKRSGNPILDLKKLLSRYCEMRVSDIRTNDIYGYLVSTFLKTIDEKKNIVCYTEAVTEMMGKRYGRKSMLKDRHPVHVLLGNIGICAGEHAHLEKLFEEFVQPETLTKAKEFLAKKSEKPLTSP